jgi:group I intron endonuclease
MPKIGCIYKITNIINGKSYIGQTTKCSSIRFKEHLNSLSRYKNRPLYKAIKKYGENNFNMEELLTIITNKDDLNFYESFFIKLYNTYGVTGYNATTGGDSSFSILPKSNNTKELLRQKRLGKKHKKETIEKMKKIHSGKKYSLGFKWSNEMKHNKIKSIYKQIPVKAENPDTGQVLIFNNLMDVEKNGFNRFEIKRNICTKRTPKMYGFKWSFI